MSALARQRYELPGTPADTTFETFAAWYETHVTAHKRGATREREILKALRKTFGPLPLREVTRMAVLEWRTDRAAAVSASTVNRETDVLKHLLQSAVPEYLAKSPIAKLARLRIVATEARILTPAEEDRLLRHVTPEDRALIMAALDTLMRLGDLLRLTWSQDHGKYLSVMNPKTGRPYEVPVSTRLRAALNAVPRRASEFIFAHRRLAKRERDWRGSVRLMLQRACKTARVRYGRGRAGVTFHCLRHTGASRMVEAGIDVRSVQLIGGWSSLRQLTRYTHPTGPTLRRAVESVGAAYHPHADPKRKRGKTPTNAEGSGGLDPASKGPDQA